MIKIEQKSQKKNVKSKLTLRKTSPIIPLILLPLYSVPYLPSGEKYKRYSKPIFFDIKFIKSTIKPS